MATQLENAEKALNLALKVVGNAEDIPSTELLIQQSIAVSTVALAHEQRTANLIAWIAANNGGYRETRIEIQQRLGL
jgi:hypothetical protein